MSEQDPQKAALNNLKEFKEMSYADVYSLICQRRFDEAKVKYETVLESVNQGHFIAAKNLQITTHFDDLLDFISSMASSVSNPEKIKAVGFDLSAHAIYETEDGICDQGIEVSLYSEDTYDFLLASDDELKLQCESVASDWQGAFMQIDTFALKGLGRIARQFHEHAIRSHNNDLGILQTPEGKYTVDPVAIARHVAKLLVAVEYHRYMAAFVEQVEVPSEMIFIIGEHDEIEVPIVFYRVGEETVETPEPPVFEAPPTIYDEAMVAGEAVEHSEKMEALIVEEEETPPLYHDELLIMQKNEAMHMDKMNSAIDDTIKLRSAGSNEENLHILEAIEEKAQKPVQAEIKPKRQPNMVSAKSMIGIPLTPRPFGQRMNNIVEPEPELDEGEQTSNKEQSA